MTTGVANGRREAVGEDFIVSLRRLRRKGELTGSKPKKSGDSFVVISRIVLTASKINAVEEIGAREGKLFLGDKSLGSRSIAVADTVAASGI